MNIIDVKLKAHKKLSCSRITRRVANFALNILRNFCCSSPICVLILSPK